MSVISLLKSPRLQKHRFTLSCVVIVFTFDSTRTFSGDIVCLVIIPNEIDVLIYKK